MSLSELSETAQRLESQWAGWDRPGPHLRCGGVTHMCVPAGTEWQTEYLGKKQREHSWRAVYSTLRRHYDITPQENVPALPVSAATLWGTCRACFVWACAQWPPASAAAAPSLGLPSLGLHLLQPPCWAPRYGPPTEWAFSLWDSYSLGLPLTWPPVSGPWLPLSQAPPSGLRILASHYEPPACKASIIGIPPSSLPTHWASHSPGLHSLGLPHLEPPTLWASYCLRLHPLGPHSGPPQTGPRNQPLGLPQTGPPYCWPTTTDYPFSHLQALGLPFWTSHTLGLYSLGLPVSQPPLFGHPIHRASTLLASHSLGLCFLSLWLLASHSLRLPLIGPLLFWPPLSQPPTLSTSHSQYPLSWPLYS